MSITNHREWIHRANQKRTEPSDFEKKKRIVRILRERFEIHALGIADEFFFLREKATNKVTIDRFLNFKGRSRELIFAMYQINKMDLYVKQREPDVIIEIDGLEHGFFDEATASQQTIDREKNYKLGGYSQEKKNYLKLTIEDLKHDDGVLVTIIEYQLGIRVKSKLGH